MDRPAAERAFAQAWDARDAQRRAGRGVGCRARERVPRASRARTSAPRCGSRRCTRPTSSSAGCSQHVDPARDAVLVVGPYHSSLRREVTIASLRAPGVDPGFAEDRHDAPHRLRADRRRRPDDPPPPRRRPPRGDGGPPVRDLVELEHRHQGLRGPCAHARPSSTGPRCSATTTSARPPRSSLIVTLAARGRRAVHLPPPAASARARCSRSSRSRSSASSSRRSSPGCSPGTGGRSGSTSSSSSRSRSLYALVCHTFGRRHPADALLLGLGGMMVLHLLDALTRRAPRVQHRVRVHADDRDPDRRARQPGLGPGLRGGAAVRRAARVAGPATHRPAHRDRACSRSRSSWSVRRSSARTSAARSPPRPRTCCSGLLLYDKKITAKAVALLLASSLVVAGLAVGFADLARPADSRTHVGRFFEKVGDEGISGFTTVIGRKALAHARDVPQHRLGAARARRARRARLPRLAHRPAARARRPRCRRCAPRSISFAVLAVLGTILNDSGVAGHGDDAHGARADADRPRVPRARAARDRPPRPSRLVEPVRPGRGRDSSSAFSRMIRRTSSAEKPVEVLHEARRIGEPLGVRVVRAEDDPLRTDRVAQREQVVLVVRRHPHVVAQLLDRVATRERVRRHARTTSSASSRAAAPTRCRSRSSRPARSGAGRTRRGRPARPSCRRSGGPPT